MEKIKKLILDLCFPIRCISCGKHDYWICDDCFSKIPLLKEHVCPLCEKNSTPNGRVCFICRERSPLNGLFAVSFYKEKIIQTAIHYFKYRFTGELHVPLGKLAVKALSNSTIILPDLLIPVPLHKRRLRWRGFNQSLLLCQYISKNLIPFFEIPILPNGIERKKYTQPQMKNKSYFKRKINLKDAFEVPNTDLIYNKSIFLVDDVATTGATLFECARVLKKSGAKSVYAIVLARQEFKKIDTL